MKKECETCVYCRNDICRDEACAGCFEDPEHANYEPKKSDDKTKEDAISILAQVHKILVNSNSWGENTHEPLNMAFNMAIKALEQTRWISVNERLPEEGLAVLTYRENGDYEVNWLDFDGKWFWEDVVKWMPLPNKPKESEKT